MLKGGVIMDVVTPEHAKIADGSRRVRGSWRWNGYRDIRAQAGVARMSTRI